MKFLSVVTQPPAIYHGCSTWKTFWVEKFTLDSMKTCGKKNIGKYMEINYGDQYVILEISS